MIDFDNKRYSPVFDGILSKGSRYSLKSDIKAKNDIMVFDHIFPH
jgi:hypothetical protein